MLIVLLDIGNTSITYGLSRGSSLSGFGSFIKDDIPKFVHKIGKYGRQDKFHLVISSVVPKLTQFISKYLKKLGPKVWVVGRNLPVPIRTSYRPLRRLGIDRLVNAYGVTRFYGAPALIIDYGTAITADYVSKAGVLEGGMIIPGPETAFQALIEKAALLPKKMRLPINRGEFLGRNTFDGMRSGILEGYGALTDGLVERFKRRYGPMRVVATGGFASHLKPYASSFDTFDPKHSVKSLVLLFKDCLRKKS